MEILSNKYNSAGVMNSITRGDVYCIIDTFLDARVDVNVLASAFNMDKTEFVGRKILVDGWNNHDTARLALLFEDDDNYTPFTQAELTTLAGIGAIVCERDLWMVFDNLLEMENINNGQGLYWNYWLHVWRTFSISPFAQAVVFTKDVFTITDVTITNADGTAISGTVTVNKGGSRQFAADVDGTGTYNGAVTWELTGANESGTYIMGGTLRIATNETATTLTLKATSIADPTQYGTLSITVG
jgi:hypothetical protein